MSLSNQSCVPCQGGTPSFSIEESNELLKELANAWSLNKEGHLYKEYVFNNFIDAMVFANKIADLAEQEAHHPDLKISWGKCSIEIWTHKINGLSKGDFILAAKINDISKEQPI